ncbi:hypothetical protein DCAR_0206151 [Daucus carota subsp. sativus]|uniref:Ubiquitin-like protease family profile domain-containing protein n=1 Tax=Daucus carota subsp. sativus TaxID=79200 RepID=A0AAF0WBL8_DAUCS|nr:hypothetical protein DCAR_0206151 [Daucus carota subsp. sativus]
MSRWYYHPLSFRSYLTEKSVKKLKKWVSRHKVFSSRYVFIPMCQSNHWNMLIICNIGEDMNSETNSPCMFLLDSLQIGEATRLEPRLREFVFHLYESGNRRESAEEIFNIPYNIPSIPQQEDGTKCGYYMLFYMFKFLTACPYQFDISKDYPGFMTEDWFDKDEFQKFYEDLTSEKEKDCSLSDTTTDKKKDGEGSSIQKIENVNNDMLQTTPSHDLFRSNDALPPLVGPLHISNTGERQSTRNVSAEEHRQQDVNHENEEAAILKNKGKLPAEEFVDIFQEGENFKTPKETLRGVEMIPQVFKEDETYSGIMSVARDIKYTYEDNEIITEELYEDKFAKMYQPQSQEEEEQQRIEPESDRDPEWPYYTNKDWKTIDILALPKYDRAYNKMFDLDDFLGDLTLGGERIDFDRFEREGDTEYNPGRLRREVKVGDSKKSPFLDRTIDFNKQKITKAEEEVWNWITADTSDATQIIFFWEDVICMSYQIKTFQFNEKISTAVIDVYATILNEDEKYRSPDSPHRFFCNTSITVCY